MGGEADADGAEDARGANKILAWVESHRVWFLCVFFSDDLCLLPLTPYSGLNVLLVIVPVSVRSDLVR